jgi:vitamin B12 transporter
VVTREQTGRGALVGIVPSCRSSGRKADSARGDVPRTASVELSRTPRLARLRALSYLILPATLIAASAGADESDLILVTANREPTPIDESGSSVSVVTDTDLADQQIVTAYDALRQLPGVEIDNTGGPGGVTSVMLRGLDGDEVKVLIDGIDVADPSGSSSQFDFANLLTPGIARIEIVRGPQSTLYGSDAMGGVINIITQSGRDDPGGEVQIEGGSYGTGGGSASLRGLAGPIDYAATIAGVHTDGIVAADAKNGNHLLDPYDNVTAGLKLGLPIDDWIDLGTVFRYVEAEHPYPGFSFAGLPDDDPGQSQSTYEYYGRAEIKFHPPGDRFENVLGFNVAETDRDYTQYGVVEDWYRGRTETVDDQATVHILPWLTGIAGGQTEAEDYADNTGLTASQRIDGFYGELTSMPLDRLALTAGIRHDQVEAGSGATTYRLTASYQPLGDGPRLHASDGTGFKAPSLYQLFVTSPYVLGDRDLKPERSRGWDVGLQQAVPVWQTVLDATYFANDITDLIDGYTDANYVYHYANIDHARTYGAELDLTAHPVDRLDLKLAYTWLRTQDLTDGGELLRRPHHTVSGTATWHATDTIQAFTTVTWIDARDDDDFSTGTIARLAPYTLLSFGGAWQVTQGISIYARMENALDRHYEEAVGYGTVGRAAYAGVKASF